MRFWRSLGTGIKYSWKTLNLIRQIILNLIFFAIVLLIIISIRDNSKSATPSYGTLVLDIEGVIIDSVSIDDDFYKLTKKLNKSVSDLTRQNSLFELTQKIEQAANDPNINAMILKLDNFAGADLPSLQYLAKYMTKFKRSGKKIYAIGGYFDQKQYYLASLANRIYLINQGSVSLYGFSANNLYFKSLLENLKINTHIFRVGTYKSAIEPFTRDDMSAPAKENTTRWLTAMWHNYLTDIANNRHTQTDNLVPSPETMLARLKAVAGNMSEYALNNNIVDKVMSYSEAEQALDSLLNYSPKISIYDYPLDENRMQSFTDNDLLSQSATPLIAVVFIDGTITTGPSANNIAGSDTIVKQLQDISKNPNIRAVVIRINSPGGGVYASEAIRSQIATLRQQNIPVVVSMGGMAASGGYWIATESDYIVANPNTITGSIGIFGIISTFENSLAHIGVYTDGVSTSPLANMTVTQNLSPEANQLIQLNIDNGYDNFLNLVADSRNMSVADVDKIAQGQVWLGQEAKQNGLVDELGSFDDAIIKAASLAELTHFIIDWPHTETSFLNTLINDYYSILPKSAIEMIYQQLPLANQFKQHIAFWDNLNDPQSRYIYCLNCSDIK